MDRVTTVLFSFLFVLALTACSDSSDQPLALENEGLSLAGGVMQSVTGSGHVHRTRPGLGTWYRTFSFNARMKGGVVSGEYQLVNHIADVGDLHGNVTCFTIDGNRAWMGGSSERGDTEDERVWVVEDNGQGMNADPDRITFMPFPAQAGFADAEEWCGAMPDPDAFGLPWHDVENGDIQIRQ